MSRTNTSIAKSLLNGNPTLGFHVETRDERQFLVYRRKQYGTGTDLALPRNPNHALRAVSTIVGTVRQ